MNSSNSEGSIEGEVVSGSTMDATLTPHDVPGEVGIAQGCKRSIRYACNFEGCSATTRSARLLLLLRTAERNAAYLGEA
jgi:hypothetical protein